MTLEQVLSKFEKARKAGSGYNVRCPAHQDDNASLTITQADDKILMHCHAGCSTAEILQHANLKASDLFLTPLTQQQEKKSTYYVYTDEKGEPKHRSVKYFINGKKAFSQEKYINGKWEKGLSGVKTYLYNLQNLLKHKKTVSNIFIVEGEKCVDILTQNKLLATTNPGGAGKWKAEYNECLKDVEHKIIILQDNDKPGEEHAKNLLTHFPKARIYNIMPNIPKADVFDYFEQGGTTEDLLYILQNDDEADKEQAGDIIEGLPFRIIQQDRYQLCENAIYDNKHQKYICNTPVIISKELESIDSGDMKVELMYKRRNNWENIIVKKTTVANTQAIITLADAGVNVNSINARGIIEYLSGFEMMNQNNIIQKKCTSQLGWVKKNCFLPFDNEVIFDADPETMKKYQAYTDMGDRSTLVNALKRCRNNNYFRFFLCGSFAAALLDVVKERGFFIHLWEDTRSGKTAALKAVLSIWGDPDTLITNFNATKVAFEKTAQLHNDLPMGIDERQLANDDMLDYLVYMIANGKGRGRGNRQGGLQTQHTWKTIALTTGEEPLSSDTSHTGVHSRLIELKGKPFATENEAREIYDILKGNYGFLGREFVETIKEHRKEILEKYEKIKETLKSKGNLESHIQYISIIMLADWVSSKYIFLDKVATFDNIFSSFVTEKEVDISERARETLESFIHINSINFQVGDLKVKRYGVFHDDETVRIYPNIIKEEFGRQGLPYKKIMAKWAERGIIKTDSTGNYSIVAKIDGRTHRMIEYTFIDDTINEIFEDMPTN
jgi:putative DNA primase/helicase